MALEEQYHRMLKLKEHFKIEGTVGYKPWYALALAIGAKFDEGLRITPYVEPKGPTAPRWKGADWQRLMNEVAAVRREHPDRKERWCVLEVYRRLPRRYQFIELRLNIAKTIVYQYITHIKHEADLLLVAGWEEIVGKWRAEKEVNS